jgi:four helix bundle protein
LKADEATHIDEIAESLEADLSSSEIFAALFDLELDRQSKADAGEEFREEPLGGCQRQPSALSKGLALESNMQSFQNLKVWERAHVLTLDVYKSSKGFPRDELFGSTSQMRRSSASTGANIAEGCCRKGDNELGRFLQIAVGSASGLEYHIYPWHATWRS